MERCELIVDEDGAGLRLDQYLVARIGGQSRSQIQRLIRDERVRVAGRAARANYPVRLGDVVTVEIPDPQPATPAAQALPVEIVYEDPHILVVNKPAGMVVHPAPGHADGTLVNALLHHVDDLSGVGGELRPGIVHRLDRGTSGLMVVAKHDEAHRELTRQFQDREVEKAYAALAWGEVMQGRRIEADIGRDPHDRKKMSARAKRARSAVTRITWSRNLRGVSAIHVAIATGRTHQIRVHLSAIGHPIVGDALYGGVRQRIPAHLRPVLRLERPFLHAMRLAFGHPVDIGRRLEFEASLPDDLRSVLADIEARVARLDAS